MTNSMLRIHSLSLEIAIYSYNFISSWLNLGTKSWKWKEWIFERYHCTSSCQRSSSTLIYIHICVLSSDRCKYADIHHCYRTLCIRSTVRLKGKVILVFMLISNILHAYKHLFCVFSSIVRLLFLFRASADSYGYYKIYGCLLKTFIMLFKVATNHWSITTKWPSCGKCNHWLAIGLEYNYLNKCLLPALTYTPKELLCSTHIGIKWYDRWISSII